MTRCQHPNAGCQEPATVVVRIGPPVAGDRALCPTHVAVLESMGMYMRRLGERVALRAPRRFPAADLTGWLRGEAAA